MAIVLHYLELVKLQLEHKVFDHKNLQYLMQNMIQMIHQVIQVYHYTFDIIFKTYCSFMTFFIFFYVYHMLRFDKAIYLSLLFNFALSERLIEQ